MPGLIAQAHGSGTPAAWKRPLPAGRTEIHSVKNPDIRVALVHLGCARNLIDSETILGRLGAEGFTLTHDVAAADVAVLNTCSFIGPAREESEGWIRELLARKQEGELRAVVVVGCLPEQFRGEVEAAYPEVDALLGLSDYSQIARVVEEVLRGRRVQPGAGGRRLAGASEGTRLLQTPRSYAYLRPSHGCDHQCAFCIIPAIRGRQRSKEVATVVEEVEPLVAAGVREVVLVAEDTTGYGTDFGPGGARLPDLVDRLAQVPGLAWLRIMYAYPHAFPWDLVEVMNRHGNVVPYLDIPIQHISSPVLKQMRRGGTRQSVERILERLRREIPGLTLRSTVLVGHPGEGEAEFQELLDFLAEFRFERLGAFAFSAEKNTPAGSQSHCSEEEAMERLQAVMEQQAEIHRQHQEARIDCEIEVLVDGREGQEALARSAADAPEVDALVRIPDPAGNLQAGAMLKARVVGADQYDLLAEASENPALA
ncbi:MAG: 30S ribosomal protein S12 methylthiotransferase RimO [Planctomycetota bacterium]|nr:MAG: 30S ribosomal protein S12 methylthiotransferase RimO [Planctomycetota bacterium]